MAYDSTFTPKGPTVLVGTTTVQVLPTNPSEQCTSYRVRCLVAAYLTWGANIAGPLGNSSPNLTATAPSAGSNSANTVGMSVGQVETLGFPQNAWFEASVAAAFEVTPGEGV